jgi:hypothetical protein
VNPDAIERATERLQAARDSASTAATTAALERARTQVEALAETAAELQATLPGRVGDAVREGVRSEAAPVGRQLAEVRGMTAQAIRRLERIEGDLAAERHARVDDLALLVDLVSAGWRNVAERLNGLERALEHAAEPRRDGGTLRAV